MNSTPTLKKCDPSAMTPPVNVVLVKDMDGLSQVSDYLGRVKEFSVDTETNVVDNFFDRKIRTIQVGDRNEQYVIDLLDFAGSPRALVDSQGHYGCNNTNAGLLAVASALRPALESGDHLKVGYYLHFDYTVLSWCLGLRPWNLYCGMLAEKVIRCGSVPFAIKGFWALDDAIARYCHLEISKDEQKGFALEGPLTHSQITYAGLDVRFPFAVKAGQASLIEKAGLKWACQIEFDAIPTFADMHMNGMKANSAKWGVLLGDVREKKVAVLAELDSYMLPIVGDKAPPRNNLQSLEDIWRKAAPGEDRKEARKVFYAARKAVSDRAALVEKCEGRALINYGSNPQLREALLQCKGIPAAKLPNTNDKTLAKLARVPVVAALRLYREYSKLLGTYGDNFLSGHTNPNTGRIHSNIEQLGAETGRTTSSNPNVQNIPHGKEWRACFVAPPGRKIITLDYSGQELRIMAELSQQGSWITAFNKGWDVHSVTAELLYGQAWIDGTLPDCAYFHTGDHQKCKCSNHAELRNKVKAVSFGLAYGLGVNSLAESLGISRAEAQKLLAEYNRVNAKLMAYLEKSGISASTQLSCRCLSGRRRLFNKPDWALAQRLFERDNKRPGKTYEIMSCLKGLFASIQRQGKNTPIQGSGADCVKIAVGCGKDEKGPFLWHTIKEYDARIINCVHDEVVIEAAEADAEAVEALAKDAMIRAGAQLVKSVIMDVESNISDEWSK